MLYFNNIKNKYCVARILFGETKNWSNYIKTEAYENVEWGDNVKSFFGNGLDIEHIYDSIDSKEADGVASALYISTGCIVYFVGLGVNAIRHKSHYIEEDFIKEDTPNGMVAYAPEKSFISKIIAQEYSKSNSKPRKYVECRGY